ncbi:MAG TPA: hypothetical protein VFP59_13745 [Candidatus Angelobacter sp.]|nr:hypothetical protein [Candidatus Angelobacter sp.]
MRSLLAALVLLLSSLLPGSASAQKNTGEPLFTISVAPPTSAKDVQLRYFLSDDAGVRWSSTLAKANGDKIQISANTAERTPKTLKVLAYAPGCQFVTFSADDLGTSTRQGDFQCTKLPTTQLQGTVPPPSGQQQLEVEAMYVVKWASRFFSVPGASISPLAIAKAPVESDGSFQMDVPDFTADPLWQSLTKNATLMFFLEDKANGHRVAELKAPVSLGQGGNLKVAANYPEVSFTIRQNSAAKNQAPAELPR